MKLAKFFSAAGIVAMSMLGQTANAEMFVCSVNTNQVLRYNKVTHEYLGVTADTSIGLNGPFGLALGPLGDLFIINGNAGTIVRLDGTTFQYKGVFANVGIPGLRGITFAPNGDLYMTIGSNSSVLRFNGQTGELVKTAVLPGAGGLSGPFGVAVDFQDRIYVANTGGNNVLRYDGKTGELIDEFIKAGSGNLQGPVGINFGPDGNFYVASSINNKVARYDGQTGAYIDDFIKSGSGGLTNPRAIVFGSTNTDLFAGSANTNQVLQYDRSTGNFVASVADGSSGLVNPRGIGFSPVPFMQVHASPSVVEVSPREIHRRFIDINVDLKVADLIGPNTTIKLVSVKSNDATATNPIPDVIGARFGTDDRRFHLKVALNHDFSDRIYTITYQATNAKGFSSFATTTVTIKAGA